MTIEQIGILFSLILTVAGWSVTAYYQKRILDRQIAAEREKEVRQLIVPRKVSEVDKIRAWLEEGERLWLLRENLFNGREELAGRQFNARLSEVDSQIRQWATHYSAMLTIAASLDPMDEKVQNYRERNDLGFLLTAIFYNMPTVSLNYDDLPNSYQHTIEIFVEFFPRAIMRANELAEQIIRDG